MEAVVNKPITKKVNDKISGMTPREFISLATSVPSGRILIIRGISQHWFRLNFYRQDEIYGNLMKKNVLYASSLIEVVEDENGQFSLEDRTIRF